MNNQTVNNDGRMKTGREAQREKNRSRCFYTWPSQRGWVECGHNDCVPNHDCL